MDARDGTIYDSEAMKKLLDSDREYMVPMKHHPTPIQRVKNKVGRNEQCPCGSGKKFKKCHLWGVNSSEPQGEMK